MREKGSGMMVGELESLKNQLTVGRWLSPVLVAALLVGCAAFDFQTPRAPDQGPAEPDARSWQAAQDRYSQAGSDELLKAVIEEFERLRQQTPHYPPLLTLLAEAHTLYGAAYADTRRQKHHHFGLAMTLSEQAMLANPGFAAQLGAGLRPTEALDQLGPDDVPAMVIRVTALSYQFREGMSLFQRLRNFRRMADVRALMERALELDPDYEAGVVPFSLAIYHIAAPAFAGGDLARAEELIERAIQTPGLSLLPRWGRAKYLYPATGNQAGRQADLAWILAQDPRAVDSPYRWNVYIQEDARMMLADGP